MRLDNDPFDLRTIASFGRRVSGWNITPKHLSVESHLFQAQVAISLAQVFRHNASLHLLLLLILCSLLLQCAFTVIVALNLSLCCLLIFLIMVAAAH